MTIAKKSTNATHPAAANNGIVMRSQLTHTQDKTAGLDSDPIRNFKFLVDFGTHNGIGLDLGFNSVEGFNMTTSSIPYRQGGYNTVAQQIPGQSEFSPISFSRGVLLGTDQNWQRMKELFNVNLGQANPRASKNFRSNVKVFVLEHPTPQSYQTAAMIFTLYNAWPTSISYSPMNAGDNGLLVEQMTMVHEGFSVDWDKATK